MSAAIAIACLVLAGCGGGAEPIQQESASERPAQQSSLLAPGDAPALVALGSAAPTADSTSADLPETTLAAAQVAPFALATSAPMAPAPGTAEYELARLATTPGIVFPARMAIEDWSGARARASTQPAWSSWLASNRSTVDTWFALPRDRSDLIAGLFNDLVDPTTGVPVAWTPLMPEPATGTTPAEQNFRGAWVANVRANNVNRALESARHYMLTGEARFAETAARQLDFYADNYANWPLRTKYGNARMMGQVLDEAVIALDLVEIARLLEGYASPARRAAWRDRLLRPMAQTVQVPDWGTMNIMLWTAAATTAIGLHVGDASLVEAGMYGKKGAETILKAGVTKDGIWYEGSFAYSNYVAAAAVRLLDHLAAAGRGDLHARVAPHLQRLLLGPLIYRFDDETLPTPGDSRSRLAMIDRATHLNAFRHVPTAYGLKAASEIRSWQALLDPPAMLGTLPALPAAGGFDGSDIRMAMLRVGQWQLFVNYGQRSNTHWQQEALNYELHLGRTAVTRDAGTTYYGSPYHSEYFQKAFAHNVPLVDGLGQAAPRPGTLASFDHVNGSIDVSHSAYRPDVQARRAFRLSAAGLAETTTIELTGLNKTPRRLGVAFHTTCSIALSPALAATAMPAPAPAGDSATTYWRNTQRYAADTTVPVALSCDGTPFEMTISGPSALAVYTATVPWTPLPATRSVIYVEVLGTRASFTTTVRSGS